MLLSVLINTGFTAVVATQGLYMSRLCMNHYLDGQILARLYRCYFFLVGISVAGLAIADHTNYSKLLFLLVILVSQMLYAYKVMIQPEEEVTNLEDLVSETNHLLTNTHTTPTEARLLQCKSPDAVSLFTSNVVDHGPLKQLSPKIKQEQIQMKQKREASPKTAVSLSNPPILAALLGANGAFAMDFEPTATAAAAAATTTLSNPWKLALITLSLLAFASAQIIYSVSIFRTNLFLPARHQSAIFLTVTAISSVLIYAACQNTTWLSDVIIQLPTDTQKIFGILLPLVLLNQSLVSLLLQLRRYYTGDKDNMITKVAFYESISTPSLQAQLA